MAAPTGVHVLKDSSITVDDVEYANQSTVARLVPDVPIQTVRTLVPDGIIQDVDAPVWTFELTIVQKNNTGGLAKALRALTPGESVEIVLRPKDLTGEDQATFTVKALPPTFGGEQGSYPLSEMVFPVEGQPVFTAIS
jgi:hypothetical protein